MSAPGMPSSAQVLITFNGVQTDVSAYVALELGAEINCGRATEFDTLQPRTLTLTLRNDGDAGGANQGQFTPDNPVSRYFPGVVVGDKVVFKITPPGGSVSSRFTGVVTSWEPDFPNGEILSSTVLVSAADALAVAHRHQMMAEPFEKANAVALANSSWSDVYPFIDSQYATQAVNLGIGSPVAATVVPTHINSGSSAFGSTLTGTLNDGALTLTSASIAGTSNASPVLACKLQGRPYAVDVWFQIDSAFNNTGDAMIVAFYDANNNFLWGIAASSAYPNGTYKLESVVGSIGTESGFTDSLRQVGVPYCISIVDNGAGLGQWSVPNSFPNMTFPIGGDLQDARLMILGGANTFITFPWVPGKQAFGWTTTFGGAVVQGYSAATSVANYGTPGIVISGAQRFADLALYAGLTITSNGTDSRTVKRVPGSGRTIMEALIQTAQTVGADMFVDGSGNLTVNYADFARSLTPAVTIAIEADDDASAGMVWKQAVDTKATRITATSPDGTVLVIDAVTEAATGYRRDHSVDTCASSVQGAAFVAQALSAVTTKLRIKHMKVDLSTAQNNLYAAMMAVYQGARIRLTGLPANIFGSTTQDVYVQGIKEVLNADSYTWEFDTSAADSPPEARYDDATYGRYSAGGAMTVTSGTAVGTTANGTLVVTTAGNPTLSTAAGDYPLDLDWNGERVTITSAPGGASSPQTVTTTARGVGGTVARSHAAAETVDAWYAARYGF